MKSYSATPQPAAQAVGQVGKIPLVLRAQPNHFAILKDPEDLRAWEADVKEQLGTPIASTSESCTESNSPANDCDTD